MATFNDLECFVQNLPNQVKLQAAQVIAETATEDFKQNFSRKGFDGTPWPQAKNPPQRGTLMVPDAHLVNSIKPVTVTADKVVIAAGDSMAPYAQIHNEGGVNNVPVTPNMRERAWVMTKNTENPGLQKMYKGIALTKNTALIIKIPRRQFIGYTKNLEKLNTTVRLILLNLR